MRRSVSQPLLPSPSQLPKFTLHASPHAPLAHVAEALARVGHARPHAPQLAALARRSTHEAPHRVSPATQPARHTPDEHTCATPHAPPHTPQLRASEVTSTSQPFAALMSQSTKPALQLATTQRPAAQPGMPLATAHAVAQAPQCAGSARRSTSQPF